MHTLRLLWATNNEEALQSRLTRINRRKMEQIVEMPDLEFIHRFRLDKQSFWRLCDDLRRLTSLKGTREISLQIKVLCTLSFLATGSYQRIVGLAQNLVQRTTSRCIRQVVEALSHPAIINKWIVFPRSQQQRAQIRLEFQRRFRLPGIVGCIDCTHVAIVKPSEDEHLFFNRKGYHSLNVQMVCDSNLKIINVNAKFGGATHDSFIWASSRMETFMRELHQNGEQVWLLGATTEKEPMAHSVMGQFLGTWMVTRRGRRFQAFRGIRYAQPPVGNLRFQPPRPILNYDEIVDARKDGPACPSHTRPGYFVIEDCLVINVYTPGHVSPKLLPVIFFIHPGGFYSSSGRSDVAGPHYLLDRDLVLVTINYRLGSLGFLALGNKLAPGNNGLKDQVVALKWVKRNIASFNGNPDLVTIAGCSAGAVSVMVHMVSPMSKGLFHRGISLSGSGTGKVPLPSNRLDLAEKQARASKCPANDTTALFTCLNTKSWRDIAGSLLKFFEFGYDPLSLWLPVVEPDFGQKRFLVEDPMVSIREGRFHSVPLIISQTTGEFYWKAYTILKNQRLLETVNDEWNRIAPISFILPRNETSDRLARLRLTYFGHRPITNTSTSANRLGKLYGDAITGFPVHRMANLMCRHSSKPVYYSHFAYVGNHSHYEDPVTRKPVRKLAAHHDDLIYLFSLSYRFPLIMPADTQDSNLVDKMTSLWYNFAKYGHPIPRLKKTMRPELSPVSWPSMKPAMKNYLRIDKEFSVLQNLYEARFQIWEELYPIWY